MFFATWKKILFAVRENDINKEKVDMSNEDKDGHDIKHPQPQPRGPGVHGLVTNSSFMLKPV